MDEKTDELLNRVSTLREEMNIHYLTNINAKEIMKYYKENNE